MRDSMAPDDSRIKYPELHDEDWLRSKYIEEDMTAKAISEQLGCAHGTVQHYLHQYDIQKRDEKTDQLPRRRWLREQYLNQGKSDLEIAEILDVPRSKVQKALQEHGICSKPKHPKYPKLRDEEWLRKKWEEDLLSPREIGELAGGAKSETVRDWLFKHEIL